MWKLKETAEGASRAENIVHMKSRLEALPKAIAEIRSLEVGVAYDRSEAMFDLVLITEFASRAALEAYQVHPAHQEVVGFVKAVTAQRAVVDYEC
jgi:hypothetical protein